MNEIFSPKCFLREQGTGTNQSGCLPRSPAPDYSGGAQSQQLCALTMTPVMIQFLLTEKRTVRIEPSHSIRGSTHSSTRGVRRSCIGYSEKGCSPVKSMDVHFDNETNEALSLPNRGQYAAPHRPEGQRSSAHVTIRL